MGLFDGTALELSVRCEHCGKDLRLCKCPAIQNRIEDTPPKTQLLKIRLDKRKRGKLVTVVIGFIGSAAQLQSTLSHLQSQCGAGGSIDGQNLELQGDHTARLPNLLAARGYRIQAVPAVVKRKRD